MSARVDTALVEIWGTQVGAVSWDDERGYAEFEYDVQFLEKGLDLAPLKMALLAAQGGRRRFSFRNLPRDTFLGLPGMLADALPDRFGNRIIDAWLARQGREASSFSPVERLCYTGRRGIGALEFAPPLGNELEESVAIEIRELAELAQEVLDERDRLNARLEAGTEAALLDILRVGTSAGGGRPKAVIAYNERTGEVRSGQVGAPPGFEHWLLKFDGVQDEELGDPKGYGRVEFAYSEMARDCSIEMSECRLLEEHGRAHFMTRRFDRGPSGEKIHLQSLCAVAHYDFQDPAAWSYEQAFQVIRELRLPYAATEQQFRRAVFNVVARNQDDHTKNIAFLMGPDGNWQLSPAYDLTYAYNPQGRWTARHQMSIQGKREEITRQDLLEMGEEMGVRKPGELLEEIQAAVREWPRYAREAGVPEDRTLKITQAQRVL